jgi:hypothetical protein
MLTRTEKLIDLIWSPLKENEFVAFDNDIYLYKVGNKNTTNSSQGIIVKFNSVKISLKVDLGKNFRFSKKESLIKLCEETSAELIANYGENSNPRVIAWHPHKDNPNMLAVNFTNHKIQLLKYE